MTHWFTEDATIPLISGGVLAVVFLFFFVMSREKVMLYIAIAVGAMAAGFFACEQLIVTDREEIVEIVYELAGYVRDNDVDGVVKHLSPAVKSTVDRARGEMNRLEFVQCRLVGVTDFHDDKANAQAKVISFVCVYQVALLPDRSLIPGQRRIVLKMERDASGQWKVIDYQHSDPREGVKL